jgi:gliding motility-associated-like protein
VVGNGNTASNSIARTYDATPPVIAAGQSFTVSQYSAAGTVVGTATASDAFGTVGNWTIATDGSGGALQISPAGVISVKNTALLDPLAGTNVSLGLTVSDGLNTSAAVPVTVRVVFVNQPPTLDVINNVSICADEQTHTIQLNGASATEPGQTYTITARSDRDIFEVLSVDASNVLSYRLKANTAAGMATVTVTIRDNGGTTGGAVDSLTRSFTVTVNALPVITISSDKGATVSKGDLVKLTATGAGSYDYAWSAADGIVGGQNSPVLQVRPQANTTYEVTATSPAGCTATGSFALSIVVDFKIDATNVLTPNGDGRNDRWVIRNLDSYPDNEVKIYDRAGRLIYSRRNYSNDWDGTVNGSPLAEGTYYYILTIQNGAKTATGYITIVRDRY